jgi:ABC-type sugar transport system ATPase subunit
MVMEIKNIQNNVLFKMVNVSKIYPGTIALKKISLEIRGGEVHGIIGKNGAGKSTLINIICGLTYPSDGEIFIGENRYKSLTRIMAKKENISVITQEPQLVHGQTIIEALFSPNYIQKRGVVNWKKMIKESDDMLNSPLLNKIKNKKFVGDLTLSEQQLLLVYKAIYLEKAKIIILDETTASLTYDDQLILYNFIKEQRKEGKAIIFISHRMQEILDICDYVSVIRDGLLINTEKCSDLNIKQLSSYITGTMESKKDISEGIIENSNLKEKSSEPVIELEKLTRIGYFKEINLSVRNREIVGLAGLRGSGRTEILKSIVGEYYFDYGYIKINGKVKKFKNPAEALNGGVVYLPEERESEGLIQELGISENLVISSLKKICYGENTSIINENKKINTSKRLIEQLSIKAISHDQKVDDLSGGNKQKVVVGKVLAANPILFLLDEPTRGIDIQTKESILSIIRNDLRKNAAIIMTSPSIEDLIRICDRILVIYKGEIVKEYKRADFDESQLYLVMEGIL